MSLQFISTCGEFDTMRLGAVFTLKPKASIRLPKTSKHYKWEKETHKKHVEVPNFESSAKSK